jgi:hypothetical protein
MISRISEIAQWGEHTLIITGDDENTRIEMRSKDRNALEIIRIQMETVKDITITTEL